MESKVGKLVNDKTAGETHNVWCTLYFIGLSWASWFFSPVFLVQESWPMHSPLWPRKAISEPWAGNSTWYMFDSLSVILKSLIIWHYVRLMVLCPYIAEKFYGNASGSYFVWRCQSPMKNMTCVSLGTWPTSSAGLISLWAASLSSRYLHHPEVQHNLCMPIQSVHSFIVPMLVCVSQVLERDGWTGLEEVSRLLNGHEFAVTG